MKALQIGTTVALISAPGNRDFLHIYNAGSETLYIGYDGNPNMLKPAGNKSGTLAVAIVNNNKYSSISLTDPLSGAGSILAGTSIIGTGIPAGAMVTKDAYLSGGVWVVECNQFISTANNAIGQDITFGDGLTPSTGWPIPSGTWYTLDTDGNKSIFNKAVYGVAAIGPVDVRVQGE